MPFALLFVGKATSGRDILLFREVEGRKVTKIYTKNSQEKSVHRDYIASVIAIIPFLIMAFSNIFQLEWLEKMDQSIGTAAVETRNGFLTPIARFFTTFGGTDFSILFLLVVCSLFFFVLNRKDLAVWYAFMVAVGAGLLNQAVKYTFKKPRPAFEHLVREGGYTFPSGHSMGSMIIYGGLFFLLLQWKRDLKRKRLLAAGFLLLILLIGLSRIYLGVHFASDVIGGYSLGASVLLAFTGWYHSHESKI